MDERDMGHVYFVQCGTTGLVKIGVTTDHPATRFGDLCRTSPTPLAGLGVVRGGAGHERRIHILFAEAWDHGEWFRPVPELLEFIKKTAPWPDEWGHVSRDYGRMLRGWKARFKGGDIIVWQPA